MKKLNINVIALALGLAFGAGALAQSSSPEDDNVSQGTLSAETKAQIESAGAEAQAGASSAQANHQAATARKEATTVRLDAMYEVAKEKCNTYPGAGKDHCLRQMKAGFGKQ